MTTSLRRRVAALCVITASALGSVSCGSVTRDGRSPAFVVIDQLTGISGADVTKSGFTLQSDVVTRVGTVASRPLEESGRQSVHLRRPSDRPMRGPVNGQPDEITVTAGLSTVGWS